jgi:uncharacterized protein (TIGR00369 family)
MGDEVMQDFGAAVVGLQPKATGDGVATVVLDATELHLNAHGSVHGGAIATLVDMAMGMAVLAADEQAQPGQLGRVVATAKVRKKGRRFSIVEAEVTQGEELIAHAISTFTV